MIVLGGKGSYFYVVLSLLLGLTLSYQLEGIISVGGSYLQVFFTVF